MTLPAESIGSIPRPPALLEGIDQFKLGKLSQSKLDALYEDALKGDLCTAPLHQRNAL
jgi:5-methyltetrahydropteroyltriglutamate--homocysteine methyltransferase